MKSSNYDVVIVGGGCAGMTAALGLARAGFAVAVVEAASYPGAENWSGCVYFGENLADPAILGPEGLETLAWERRLVERGVFASDGHGLLGMTYRDPLAFRHCYTVLRPVFDHHLALLAAKAGVLVLNDTTAESLIRDAGRVVGVSTQRGPLYADLVFLAEGDASHLVSREGYERIGDRREQPKFLQGIKQIIELPPGAVEEHFQLGPDEGAAYELLLRNGTLRGKPVHLNMGGFVYTNKQSLSVGLVLPVDNLRDHFGGDPNLLMEWFEELPVLKPWLKEGRRGAFGAKIIRGGGIKEVPRLIDDGLAIGGAASGIGIDFPYPNFTGPATGMGLLLVRAAIKIREQQGRFTEAALRQHYLEPLQKTNYWQDVEFLRHWPAYVKRTTVFFDRNIDLALGSAYVWTRPDRWLASKWHNWLKLIWQVAGPRDWPELRGDVRQLNRALHIREVVGRPGAGRLLLDGAINAFRDLLGRPRAHLPPAGTLELHYRLGETNSNARPPWWLRRWFQRFAPVLAPAAKRLYANDGEPLEDKLVGAAGLLVRQVNMLDVLGAGVIGLAAAVGSACLAGWQRLKQLLLGRRIDQGLYGRYARVALQAADLTPRLTAAAQHWEGRLGHLAYQSIKESHIQLQWPQDLAKKNAIVRHGLWNVCPAHVYEARVNDNGQLQLVVNHENCIKCETCWRSSDEVVDWGRDGAHRFIYPVRTPAAARVLAAAQSAGLAATTPPHSHDWWSAAARDLSERLRQERPSLLNGATGDELVEVESLLDRLERKLEEFGQACTAEPRTIDRARADHLEMLARYPQQLAGRVLEILRGSALGDASHASLRAAQNKLIELANALNGHTEDMVRRCIEQHYHWAAADGRQISQHHLVGLRRFLQVVSKYVSGPTALADPAQRWLQAEDDAVEVAEARAAWVQRLDAALPANLWRDLDKGQGLAAEQDALLRDLLAQAPPLDPANLTVSLHPPLRKMLLAELARRDPSLAIRAAAHWQARDLARLAAAAGSPLSQAFQRWARGDEWASFAVVDAVPTGDGAWQGEALYVAVGHARSLLLLVGDQLAVIDRPNERPGLVIEPVPTLGLRGGGICRIRLDGFALPAERLTVDPDRLRRAWSVLSAADLTSIATGLADLLCRRAAAHAASRVQFPGLFWDEQARDPIGKFGAVKKMLAEMGARRYLIETLDHVLSPADLSAASVDRAGLVKLVVAEALGTSPGSLTYNAVQIFGGTGYSEDDILAKSYRDAAAWRFLEPGGIDQARHHGAELLRNWRPDGHALAALPGEAENFGRLAQRKALQEELDELRVCRSQLRALVNEWDAAAAFVPNDTATQTLGPKAQAEVAEGLGRQDALLLASKALLLRTHARLERGVAAEAEVALLRVWLQDVSRLQEEFEGTVRRHFRRTSKAESTLEVGPALPTRYRDYLATATPYDSGDFLRRPADSSLPRYVPELVEADPELAARNRELRDLVASHFGQPRGDGQLFERHIEQQHRPGPDDLDFCRRHDFFRMMIPKELGGAGRSKAEYYLLTTNTQRLADIAITLTIQVNTSIGTTPVLLARDKELPRAQKEMTAFLGDRAPREEAQEMLAGLVRQSADADFDSLIRASAKLQERLEAAILTSSALKALFHHFLESWQSTGRAGKAFDRAGLVQHLAEAQKCWHTSCARAEEYQQEIGRRRQACDLFLRWVASGQISAFALTEPSAGSDTARVATRAVPRSVPVLREADGVLRFTPFGASEQCVLLDARRLEFKEDPSVPSGQRACYRWSESAEPAPIQFDEYDYETDDADHQRYYLHGDRKIYFTDIGQLRERDGQYYYDYWELTGAKMWITNGRMCGILALYAKSDEGITGFIVDRHAEGLIVGKDEEKLGQCGSPTNELSLQAVRVPRENVIGIEGRGQVNALETLNVGRAGLPMAALAQMQGLIEQSRAFVLSRHGELPDWAAWRLDRMEEEQFFSGALVYEVVGRSEHPRCKSVRMESAIAKMLVTESLHRVIELAEELHGLAGQTQLHLVEKRKRDARVLNIYEGTNEVQRFLVLKKLADLRGSADGPAAQPGSELEMLRLALLQRVDSARAVFGGQLWQNPNLQSSGFLLAEAVAWYKAADSTAGRLAWISAFSRDPAGEREQPDSSSFNTEVGKNALARCLLEAKNRLRRFDEELTQLRRGFYAPEVRAACLMMDRPEPEPAAGLPASQISRPMTILVVVEPALANLPSPQVHEGKLLEAHWTLSEADSSALEAALRLRDAADAPVSIQVAAVGPRSAAPALRTALALGVDRVRLVIPESEAVSADSAAAALVTLLQAGPRFDLVLGGGGSPVSEEGLVARLTAAALGMPHAGMAEQLSVRVSGSDGEAMLLTPEERQRSVALPAAITLPAGLTLRPYTTESYLASLARAVEAERWPKKLEARPVAFAEAARQTDGQAEAAPGPLSPRDAAGRVLLELGLRGSAAAAPKPFEGAIEDVASPSALRGAAVAILAADADGRLQPTAATTLQAAKLLADLEGIDVVAWLLLPQGAAEAGALAQLRVLFRGNTVVMPLHGVAELRGHLLQECWQAAALPIKLAVGEPWTAPVFEVLGGRLLPAAVVAGGVRQIDFQGDHAMLSTSRLRGKVRARQLLAAGLQVPCFVSLASEVQLSDNRSVVAGRLKPFKADELRDGKVWRWTPKLERFYGRGDIQRLLEEVRTETGLTRLTDADFIIDVGFGVGNRDGYEAVIEPLHQALKELGVRGLAIGGSRKVTEELHLLPADRQIGQSGVSVQPRILLAIGISGAPQHLDYIGGQAVILAFNRDPEAPLMTLGQRKPRPKVFPVVGNLFETVPALIAALRLERESSEAPPATSITR